MILTECAEQLNNDLMKIVPGNQIDEHLLLRADADNNKCSKAPKYFDKLFDDGTDIVKKCRPATTKSPCEHCKKRLCGVQPFFLYDFMIFFLHEEILWFHYRRNSA